MFGVDKHFVGYALGIYASQPDDGIALELDWYPACRCGGGKGKGYAVAASIVEQLYSDFTVSPQDFQPPPAGVSGATGGRGRFTRLYPASIPTTSEDLKFERGSSSWPDNMYVHGLMLVP